MGWAPRISRSSAQRSPDLSALQPLLESHAAELATTTGADVADWFGGLVPEVDKAALTGEFADFIAASSRDSIRTGIWGWFDDDLAFYHDWGFELSSIRLPVTIWQGTEDKMVPFAHGRWLAEHVPGATARLMAGEGHLSLGVGSFDRIVDELLGGAV